jgi:hypothetical protein
MQNYLIVKLLLLPAVKNDRRGAEKNSREEDKGA